MTYVSFENSAAPIGEEDFDWLSRRIGIHLPQSAKAQYLEFNGGEPSPYVFTSGRTKFVIQQFFSIRHGMVGSTIEDNYEDLVLQNKIIPSDLIPFAVDPAGDYYCLSVENGEVSMFRSEYMPDLSRCITRLADSMQAFVAGFSDD